MSSLCTRVDKHTVIPCVFFLNKKWECFIDSQSSEWEPLKMCHVNIWVMMPKSPRKCLWHCSDWCSEWSGDTTHYCLKRTLLTTHVENWLKCNIQLSNTKSSLSGFPWLLLMNPPHSRSLNTCSTKRRVFFYTTLLFNISKMKRERMTTDGSLSTAPPPHHHAMFVKLPVRLLPTCCRAQW